MDGTSAFIYYFKLFAAYGGYYLSRLVEHYRDYPYEIQIAAGAIVVSVVLMAFIALSGLLRQYARRRDRRTERRLRRNYGAAADLVFSAQDGTDITREDIVNQLSPRHRGIAPDDLLRNRRERRIFCRMVYRCLVSQTTGGPSEGSLHLLLNIFGVPSFLEEEAIVGSTRRRVQSMEMARTFKLYVSPWIVNKLLKDKRPQVRRQAQYAAIMSSGDSDLSYFETDFFDRHSCLLDEIELGYALWRRSLRGQELPNLAQLSGVQKNDSTKVIFVRLMRRFAQHEHCVQLVPILDASRHKGLIREICTTWGHLGYTEGEHRMERMMTTQPWRTKVAILHAVTRMQTGRSLHLLREGYENTPDPHVRFEALRCLHNYGAEGANCLRELEHAATEDERHYFRFFHNPLTQARLAMPPAEDYRPTATTVFSQVGK